MAPEGVALPGAAGERDSIECQLSVIVRLHPENSLQTPTECQALYQGLHVCFVLVYQAATRSGSFSKTDVPATHGQFLHKLN